MYEISRQDYVTVQIVFNKYKSLEDTKIFGFRI